MEQYLTFLTNNQQFAIEIASINKIIDYIKPTKVPEAIDYMIGVIEYNESILPIISLSQRLFGQDSLESKVKRVIVLNWNGKQIGYEVDDILGIRSFSSEEIELANPDLGITKDYIHGYIKDEKDVIIILDNDKVFTGRQAEMLIAMNA